MHPTLPFVLTCSDDMSIKLWDWDKDWALVRLFEGHTHYVMGVQFNPKALPSLPSLPLPYCSPSLFLHPLNVVLVAIK